MMNDSPQVLEHFRHPHGTGELAPGQGVAIARSGTPASKAVLELGVRGDHGRIFEARFKAYGCPSTIAAGSWLCQWLTDRSLADAAALTAADIAEALGLAPVKRHCAVLAEDALRAVLRKMAAD